MKKRNSSTTWVSEKFLSRNIVQNEKKFYKEPDLGRISWIFVFKADSFESSLHRKPLLITMAHYLARNTHTKWYQNIYFWTHAPKDGLGSPEKYIAKEAAQHILIGRTSVL